MTIHVTEVPVKVPSVFLTLEERRVKGRGRGSVDPTCPTSGRPIAYRWGPTGTPPSIEVSTNTSGKLPEGREECKIFI